LFINIIAAAVDSRRTAAASSCWLSAALAATAAVARLLFQLLQQPAAVVCPLQPLQLKKQLKQLLSVRLLSISKKILITHRCKSVQLLR